MAPADQSKATMALITTPNTGLTECWGGQIGFLHHFSIFCRWHRFSLSADTIPCCASSNSLHLEIPTKSVINLKHYGYATGAANHGIRTAHQMI
jgi:hypothetical protein